MQPSYKPEIPMADPNFNARKPDKSPRASEPGPVQKPDFAQPDVRDESGAKQPTASRPRGKTEDPDRTL